MDQGIFEDYSLPAWAFLQAQITAELPSYQSFASATCRMRLQGKGQQGITPKQQGSKATGKNLPQKPHFSHWMQRKPDMEEVGRQHCPALAQSRVGSLPHCSHRSFGLSVGRCLWLENLAGAGAHHSQHPYAEASSCTSYQ